MTVPAYFADLHPCISDSQTVGLPGAFWAFTFPNGHTVNVSPSGVALHFDLETDDDIQTALTTGRVICRLREISELPADADATADDPATIAQAEQSIQRALDASSGLKIADATVDQPPANDGDQMDEPKNVRCDQCDIHVPAEHWESHEWFHAGGPRYSA